MSKYFPIFQIESSFLHMNNLKQIKCTNLFILERAKSFSKHKDEKDEKEWGVRLFLDTHVLCCGITFATENDYHGLVMTSLLVIPFI